MRDRSRLPRGTFLTLRGQVETMRHSYGELLAGLAFSIVLIYLLIVVNFQSWLDPFVIITALPAALAGHRAVPLLYPDAAQCAGLDGRYHVHGRGDG